MPVIKRFSLTQASGFQACVSENRLIRGMLVHLQGLAAFGDMHLTFVRAKGTVGTRCAHFPCIEIRPTRDRRKKAKNRKKAKKAA